MTLSDKEKDWAYKKDKLAFYWKEDVVEAVKKLMDWVNQFDLLESKHYVHKAHIRKRIRKIFGEELTGGKKT